MNDRSYINFELKHMLERQLEPGETVVWADQPVARYFNPFTVAQLIVGLFWTGIMLVVLAHSYAFKWPAFDRWQDFGYPIFFIPFFLFGLYFILSPWRERQRTVQTVYAITDRRVISVWNRRKPFIRTYSFDAIRQIRIAERRGGVGDVIIVSGVRVVGETSAEDKDGFYHIRNAREVARCLEKQIDWANPSEGTEPETVFNKSQSEEMEGSPRIVQDDAPEPRFKGLPSLLLLPLFLLGIGAIVLLAFGLPAAIAWATNTGGAGFIFFLLLSFLLPQVRHIFTAKESTEWPTAQGVIDESYILADSDGGYSPRVRYTYQANGKEYESTEITTKQRSDTLNRIPAKTIIAQYPEGHAVTVYYNPRKPSYAVLEPGRGFGNWAVLAILLPCCLASGIWAAVTWEGFDTKRYGRKWQEVKQYVGLGPADEEKKPPVTVTLPAEQDPVFKNKQFRVTSQHLWVNAAPFGDNEVIGDLPNGAIVKVFREKELWALVQTPSGQGGWVLRQSLKKIEERPPPDTKAVTASERPPPDTRATIVPETPPVTVKKHQQVNRTPVKKRYRVYPAQDVMLFFLAVVEGNIDVVRRYIKGGISPNIKRPNRGTAPLFLAVSHGRDDVALLLIEAGADVEGNNNIGIPLIWAAEHCDSVELVRTLIEAGADVNAKARGSATPLMMARVFKCPEIEQILLAAGAQ